MVFYDITYYCDQLRLKWINDITNNLFTDLKGWTILPRSSNTNVTSTKSGPWAKRTCYRAKTSNNASSMIWRYVKQCKQCKTQWFEGLANNANSMIGRYVKQCKQCKLNYLNFCQTMQAQWSEFLSNNTSSMIWRYVKQCKLNDLKVCQTMQTQWSEGMSNNAN